MFSKGDEPLPIHSVFIQGDDGLSYNINLDTINIDMSTHTNGVIQYTVQTWDTLLKIASVFWSTVSSIKKDNTLKNDKNDALTPGLVLKVSNQIDGIVYKKLQEKINVVVFANKYNLNLQDVMTLNYVQDESEIFGPGQEIFINISKEKAIDLWLLDRPPPLEIIVKSTVPYRPVINKSKKVVTRSVYKPATIIADLDDTNDAPNVQNKIISQWTYTKKIKNGFYAWYCTWYAAIMSPQIFPYIDDTTQDRPFGGDAAQWCANAKKAWFRVGNTPAVGALIVYKNIISYAGHVGKVINYYPDDNKMIIRDMNYVAKFVVSERWENVDNKKITCYIYGK